MKTINKYTSITLATLLFSSTLMAEDHKHAAHWGYEGDTAPKNWSKLDKKFQICSEGLQQSPIDIVATNDVALGDLDLSYTTTSSDVLNNGHTIQVNIKNGSTFTIDNKVYELKQFHFHSPSENNINGKEFPLEAHFVHATKEGDLAVVGVMFKVSQENLILSKIWDTFPIKEAKTKALTLTSEEINALLPTNKEYYTFMGSLTTPPCSEQVKWHVFKTPINVSQEQVDTFFKIFGHATDRPVQKSNKRVISE